MAFSSISNGRITQTGVDNDLSGLSGVSGVVVSTYIGSASGTLTVYDLGSNGIDVSGNLTHDPDREKLVFNNCALNNTPVSVEIGGTYTLGNSYIKNGETVYATGTGILDITSLYGTNGLNGSYRNRGAVVVNGGTFNWLGGCIDSPFAFSINSGILTIQKGCLYVPYNRATNNPSIWIQSGANLVNIENLDIYSNPDYRGVSFQFSLAPSKFDNVRANFAWGITTGGSTLTSDDVAIPITIRNFSAPGSDQDACFWRENYIKLINFVDGTNAKTGGMLTTSNVQNLGIIEFHQDLFIGFRDVLGVAVENVRVRIHDYDDGNREPDWRGLTWESDRIYDEVSDPNGELGTTIMTGASIKRTGGGTQDNINLSRRGLGATSEDIFEIHPWSYLYKYITITKKLQGLQGTNFNQVLVEDLLINEKDKTVVDNYSELDTSSKVYDYQKTWKLVGDNIELPTLKTLPATKTGETLEAGDYNVIIDATSSDLYNFDGTNITIKASIFKGNIRTTGNVTLQNGSTIDGSIIDSEGDATIIAITPVNYRDEIAVYPTLPDAEAETNVLSNSNSYTYNSSEKGGDEIWFRLENNNGSYIIDKYILPATPGIYKVEVVITSEQDSLDELLTLTKEIRLNTNLIADRNP